MARLRPSPRLQTPSDNEGPAPPKRATRSQTRDTSVDLPSPSQINRTRSTKTTGAAESQADDPIKKRGRGAGRPRKDAAAPLGTVLEGIEVDPLNDMVNSAAEFIDDQRPGLPKQHERLMSQSLAPSGVTNLTTHSQAELQELDADMIVEAFAELDRNAQRLLEKATPADYDELDLHGHVEQLHERGSRLSKQLKQLAKVLEATQDGTFGSQTYIDPHIILRCLLETHIEAFPKGSWRPDAIIYKANLANFVDMICSIPPDSEQVYDTLASLDVNFPSQFVSKFVHVDEAGAGTSMLIQDTFEMALELRTQLAILNMIQKRPETLEEANNAICQIFVDAGDGSYPSDKQGYESTAKAWEELPLSQQEIAGFVTERIMALREPFNMTSSSASVVEALDLLKKEYTWSKFLVFVLSWARRRLNELNEELDFNGGTNVVIQQLEKAMGEWARNGGLTDLQSVQNNVAASALTRKGYTPDAMAEVKKRMKQRKSTTQNPAHAASETVSAPPVSDQQVAVHDDDEEYQDIDSVSPLRAAMRQVEAHNKENTENVQPQKRSLFDPQENGQRVIFDEYGDSQQTGSSMRLQQPRSLRAPEQQGSSPPKRQREPVVEDPSEDEGFQHDERAPTTKRVRMDTNVISRPGVASTSARPAATVSTAPLRASQPASSRDSPYLSPRRNPGQAIDPAPVSEVPYGTQPPPLTESERYRQTQHAARSIRPVREQRTRRPWTVEEIGTLFDLAAEHGTSYTVIKKADEDGANMMEGRSQGDIKDKMRNMKFDYLKARQPLPPGFQGVPLPKAMLEKLARDYDVHHEQAPQRTRRTVHAVEAEDGQ